RHCHYRDTFWKSDQEFLEEEASSSLHTQEDFSKLDWEERAAVCFLILCNAYANHLKELSHKYSTNNLILGGDFNMVYDKWLDRSHSKFQSHHISSFLHNFCLELSLIDPWRLANPLVQSFSWFKALKWESVAVLAPLLEGSPFASIQASSR
uniref:Endonuclease/exonuclease/phosphatase domain-containing protein n=1 Tax=Pundamilia nyererei TaxID=303518 RepID=A0A3B4F0I0_9CICH